MNLDQISALIRDVPDFPKPGILFKDITPLLAHPVGFERTIDHLVQRVAAHAPQQIAAIESRGFIFGSALAIRMGLPLQLVRKSGKLPYRKIAMSYELEYGSDRVEMHEDAVVQGERYAIIDDLIATGGTAGAAASLIEQAGGKIACFGFIIELGFLDGRQRLGDRVIEALIRY